MEFRDKQIAPPKSWEKFEDLTLSLFKAIWADPLAQKNGRRGQPQHGVDVFGSQADDKSAFHGVQCKGKDQAYGQPATAREMQAELAKAEKFSPELNSWVFATTSPVDGKLQRLTRELSAARIAQGRFPVTVLGWEDIQHLLAEHPGVLRQYYPEHALDLDALIAAIQSAPSRHDFEMLRRDLLDSVGQPAAGARGGESQDWVAVTFDQTRDLGPALMGRALGAADVFACPILPEVATIVAELQRAFVARLIGESGSGKSVCALQVARAFSDRGFHVARLQHAGVRNITLEPNAHATLYLIDDAHLASPVALRAAEETAGPKRLLLSIHTAHPHTDAGRGAIRLDARRAVQKIAAALRADMPTTLRVISRLDDRVGDRPHDEWLETRLEHAEKVSDMLSQTTRLSANIFQSGPLSGWLKSACFFHSTISDARINASAALVLRTYFQASQKRAGRLSASYSPELLKAVFSRWRACAHYCTNCASWATMGGGYGSSRPLAWPPSSSAAGKQKAPNGCFRF